MRVTTFTDTDWARAESGAFATGGRECYCTSCQSEGIYENANPASCIYYRRFQE